MPRVTKSVTAKAKHKKVLSSTKGHYGARSRLYKTAKQSNIKSLQYAFRDRKNRKRDFRKLWIIRINAAVRQHGLSYSKFIASLKENHIEINFLICGDGELKSDIERRSSSLKNIFFTGWINRSEINVLSSICHLSIAPYINNATFKNTVSNKMIDYLSLGLPIVTSIDGSGAQYLKKNNTAIIYDENDYKTLISEIERSFHEMSNVSEMRLASLNLYKNIYSYEIVYENAYKKILGLKDS